MIIYLNTILTTGAIGYMFVDLHEAVREKIEEWRLRKAQKSVTPAAPGDSITEHSDTRSMLASSQKMNFGTGESHNLEITTIQEDNSNARRMMFSPENYLLPSGNDSYFTGIDLSNQIVNLSTHQEQPQEVGNSPVINQERDPRITPVNIPNKFRTLKKRKVL